MGTEHGARGTGHGARCTGHGARGTMHGARGTGHGANVSQGVSCCMHWGCCLIGECTATCHHLGNILSRTANQWKRWLPRRCCHREVLLTEALPADSGASPAARKGATCRQGRTAHSSWTPPAGRKRKKVLQQAKMAQASNCCGGRTRPHGCWGAEGVGVLRVLICASSGRWGIERVRHRPWLGRRSGTGLRSGSSQTASPVDGGSSAGCQWVCRCLHHDTPRTTQHAASSDCDQRLQTVFYSASADRGMRPTTAGGCASETRRPANGARTRF
jgi:hypothetical protein